MKIGQKGIAFNKAFKEERVVFEVIPEPYSKTRFNVLIKFSNGEQGTMGISRFKSLFNVV